MDFMKTRMKYRSGWKEQWWDEESKGKEECEFLMDRRSP